MRHAHFLFILLTGLQMGYLLDRAGRDYVIFEKSNIAGKITDLFTLLLCHQIHVCWFTCMCCHCTLSFNYFSFVLSCPQGLFSPSTHVTGRWSPSTRETPVRFALKSTWQEILRNRLVKLRLRVCSCARGGSVCACVCAGVLVCLSGFFFVCLCVCV